MRPKRIALIIPAHLSQPIRVEKINTTLATRQTLVAGNVEVITSQDWHVYLNDEADFIPLPLNARAEVLIREAGLHLEETVSGRLCSSATKTTAMKRMHLHSCSTWPNASSTRRWPPSNKGRPAHQFGRVHVLRRDGAHSKADGGVHRCPEDP